MDPRLRWGGRTGLARQHGIEQFRQARCVILEDGHGARRIRIGFVFVHQRVVYWAVERRRLGLPRLPGQRYDLLEMRAQSLKICFGAGRAPDRLTVRRGARPGLHQIRRNRADMDPLPPHLAQIRRLPMVESGFIRGRVVQQIGNRRPGQNFMREDAECRQLLGARSRTAGRHHHRHIPMQDTGGFLDQRQPPEQILQPVVRTGSRCRHSSLRPIW